MMNSSALLLVLVAFFAVNAAALSNNPKRGVELNSEFDMEMNEALFRAKQVHPKYNSDQVVNAYALLGEWMTRYYASIRYKNISVSDLKLRLRPKHYTTLEFNKTDGLVSMTMPLQLRSKLTSNATMLNVMTIHRVTIDAYFEVLEMTVHLTVNPQNIKDIKVKELNFNATNMEIEMTGYYIPEDKNEFELQSRKPLTEAILKDGNKFFTNMFEHDFNLIQLQDDIQKFAESQK